LLAGICVGRLALGFPCSKNLLPARAEHDAACNRDAARHASDTESDAARESRSDNKENFVNRRFPAGRENRVSAGKFVM
jgi:hypothetical protein